MDIAKDLIHVLNTVAGYPALNVACALATQILITVQKTKENSANLQYLAHLVANTLIDIAEHMKGRWDNASPFAKSRLDTFVVTLQDINKFITKYSSNSRFRAFLTSYDRQTHIQRLKERLIDARLSLLISLGVETSTSLNVVKNTQIALISRWEELLLARAAQYGNAEQDPDLQIHVPADFIFLQRINEYKIICRSEPESTIHITLDEAKRVKDGQFCMVKSYQGAKSKLKELEMRKDVDIRKKFRHPLVLQLIGASKYTITLPFQVYYAPENSESIRLWMQRTLKSNPVETLCGLFEMRKAIMAIQKFESEASLEGDLGNNLLVNVRQSGRKLLWTAVYAGELTEVKKTPLSQSQLYYRIVTNTIVPHWFDPSHKYQDYFSNRHAPDAIADHLCRGTFYCDWAYEARNLEDITQCDYSKLTLQQLETIFAENVWFAPSKAWIPPGTFVRLGDIGYVTEDGDVEFLGNIHDYPSSTEAAIDGAKQTQKYPVSAWQCYYDFSGGETVEAVSKKEHLHGVYEQMKYQANVPSREYFNLRLYYTNVDRETLLRNLKLHAAAIISKAGLSIPPHSLKLVIESEYEYWLTLETVAPVQDTSDALSPRLHPQGELSHHVPTKVTVIDKIEHDLYAFVRGGGLEVNDHGVPGLRQPQVKIALHPTPSFLDDKVWDLTGGTDITGEATGERVSLSYTTYQNIHYLQLPVDYSSS